MTPSSPPVLQSSSPVVAVLVLVVVLLMLDGQGQAGAGALTSILTQVPVLIVFFQTVLFMFYIL